MSIVLLVFLLPTSSPAQSPDAPLQATDLEKIKRIREVELSPSGRSVVYTARQAVPVRSSRGSASRTHLYVASASGRGQPRQLTRTEGAREPAWHPNGNRIAFVRPVEETPQIFVLSLSGGEPYQLTDSPYGARRPRWGPSGNRLLFASSVPEASIQRRSDRIPPSERPGRSPGDTVLRVPPDTLLVLRRAGTLDPVDSLALGPEGLQPPADTSRSLRLPDNVDAPAPLQNIRIDSLRTLSPDSLRTVFDQLELLPDTTTIPAPADTVARPDGDLLQIRRWLDQRLHTEAKVFTRPHLHGGPGRMSTMTYNHYFVVDVPQTATTGDPARPPTRPVTHGYRSYESASWLPGGSQIVVSAPPAGTIHPDRVEKRNLYVVDLAPYRITRLLEIDGYAVSDPRLTTDGTTVAFRAHALPLTGYDHAEIGLFELDGRSDPQFITETFDRDITTYRWSPDGWYLYVTAPSQGGRPLYRFAPFARGDTSGRGQTSLQDDYTTSRDTFELDPEMIRTAVYDQVLETPRVVQAFDVTASNAVYATRDRETPSELYANTISFGNEERISSLNTPWTRNRQFSDSRFVDAWNGAILVRGRLTPPIKTDPTRRAPLVVIPRGGPPMLDTVDPVSTWTERQYLAGLGYGVLEVWPRGSVGYGESYRRANFQDWGPGPATDVLTLVDSVASENWVNGEQLVLAGRSYGATVVPWVLSQSNQFRAAVAQSGVYDLDTFFGGSDAAKHLPDHFGGMPWDETPPPTPPSTQASPILSVGLLPSPNPPLAPDSALQRSNPMTTVHRLDTPLLLLHGADDEVASPVQADMLYRRLKTLERPVEYVDYPGVRHSFSTASPTQRIDRLVRLREFFRRYVTPVQAESPQ